MGLDLRADGYAKEEFCMGYIGFGILRQYIAKCYNEEFGAMYEKIYRFPHPFIGMCLEMGVFSPHRHFSHPEQPHTQSQPPPQPLSSVLFRR